MADPARLVSPSSRSSPASRHAATTATGCTVYSGREQDLIAPDPRAVRRGDGHRHRRPLRHDRRPRPADRQGGRPDRPPTSSCPRARARSASSTSGTGSPRCPTTVLDAVPERGPGRRRHLGRAHRPGAHARLQHRPGRRGRPARLGARPHRPAATRASSAWPRRTRRSRTSSPACAASWATTRPWRGSRAWPPTTRRPTRTTSSILDAVNRARSPWA